MSKKPWSKLTNLNRKSRDRDINQSFLIVCEGKETEPNYFKSFRSPRSRIVIKGKGMGTKNLVEFAIRETTFKNKELDFDQVWCVFDRDEFTPKSIQEAFSLAKKNNIKIAYSNECFELWYQLHFENNTTPINRKKYLEKLNKYFKNGYKKSDPNIFDLLLDKQSFAIKNAKSLRKRYRENFHPINDVPITTVYELVEELNKYSK